MVCVGLVVAGGLLQAGTIAEGQKSWYQKYKKQENAPDPVKMLLNTDPEPGLKEGFKPLFNGRDLEGWVSRGGKAKFEARDGMIVGTCVPGTPSTYLSTEKADYGDFVATLEVKWAEPGNSGLMIRAQSRPGKKGEEVFGPQIELEGPAKDRFWNGAVYGQSCGGYWYPLWLEEHEKARQAFKKDDWNRVTVEARGKVIKTWLNGVPAAHWVGDGTYSKGFFGLQVHSGKKGTVLFRRLKVKEFKGAK